MSQSENKATTDHFFLTSYGFCSCTQGTLAVKGNFWSEVCTILVLNAFVALGEVLADFQLCISSFTKQGDFFACFVCCGQTGKFSTLLSCIFVLSETQESARTGQVYPFSLCDLSKR